MCALWACSAKAPVAPPSAAPAGEPIYAMLAEQPDFALDLRPHALERDRQAVSLQDPAAEGASIGMGKILRGSERVLVVTQREGAHTEVGMALIGIPASFGIEDVQDEAGERLLSRCKDVELPVPCWTHEGDTVRRVYVVEPRQWFVAVGARAAARAEEAIRTKRVATAPALVDPVLWRARYRGASLRKSIPKLRVGPLAPIAEGLEEVTIERHRRSDLTYLRAEYTNSEAAADAEPLATRILGLWRRGGEGRAGTLEHRGAQLIAQLRGELTTEPTPQD